MYKVGEKKIIVYGMGVNFYKSLDYLRDRFVIVGCSDSDITKTKAADSLGIEFIIPEKIKDHIFDFIIITTIYGKEIKDRMVFEFKIDSEKVLQISDWSKMDFMGTFGNKNSDKIFYVLSKPIRANNGIISILYMLLEQLCSIEGCGYIPVVDMQSYKNQYLNEKEIGLKNAWEKFFEQLSPYSLSEVYKSKNVILGYDNPGYLCNYSEEYNMSDLIRMYKRYIFLKKDVEFYIDKEVNETISGHKGVLGVLYRGTDMTSLKLKNHMIQPSLDELYSAVCDMKNKYGCKYIFLSTEDESALEFFLEKEGKYLLYTKQNRYKNTGNKWIAEIENDRENDCYLRGVEYISTIYILSKCDYLVSGVVAGSIGALIMNEGKYKDIFLIDKGYY